MNKAVLQSIQDKIISGFDKDYSDFLSYLERETNPDIQEFLKKYLDWYVNKPMLLYKMFDKVIYRDNNYIWSSLISFVGNYFKDDAYFTILWMTVDYKNYATDEDGKYIDVITNDKEDMFAFPVLISDQDYGTQNVREVLNAMEQYEINDSLWEEELNGM
jgi:hypothetical protein